MKIKLAYGKTGLDVELPDGLDVTVVRPGREPGLVSPEESLAEALGRPLAGPPLREMVRPGMRVGIVFSDITRPAPSRFMVSGILKELAAVPDLRITLFNALGTHRRNTEDELREVLGDAIAGAFPIVQNDAFSPGTLAPAGRTSFGNEVLLNAEFLRSDLKVLTGFIEPHMFAGFSGGGKAVLPGMAGLSSVLRNHGFGMIGHPGAVYGAMEGNPVREDIAEAARMAGPSFLVNVTMNGLREVTGIFAGEVEAAHAAGCAFAARSAVVHMPRLYDIVITSNAGHPLDINLYQAVKGMRAAERIVRPGGAIIVAARCPDGIPEHGLYGRLLRGTPGPRALLERLASPGPPEHDQWQAQVQAIVRLKAEVHVFSGGLTADEIRSCGLEPCRKVEETVALLLERSGRRVSICVMPDGPQVIPCPPGE